MDVYGKQTSLHYCCLPLYFWPAAGQGDARPMRVALVLYGNVIVDEIEFRILSHDAETHHSNARTRHKVATRRKEVVESVWWAGLWCEEEDIWRLIMCEPGSALLPALASWITEVWLHSNSICTTHAARERCKTWGCAGIYVSVLMANLTWPTLPRCLFSYSKNVLANSSNHWQCEWVRAWGEWCERRLIAEPFPKALSRSVSWRVSFQRQFVCFWALWQRAALWWRKPLFLRVCVWEGVFDKLLVACVWTFCTYSVSRDVQSCCDPYATSFPFSIRRLFQWYNFIRRTILGLHHAYLSCCMRRRQCSHGLCSHASINFSVPSVCTKARQKGFFFFFLCPSNLEHTTAGSQASGSRWG